MIYLVHGFNVYDGGKKTIAKLAPYFEESGHDVKVFSYGWIRLMGAWFLNPRIATQLASLIRPVDSGIGHSNGCVKQKTGTGPVV